MIDFLGQDTARLGMGCWAIGGPFFWGDAPLGYADADDAMAIRTVHAALDAGVSLFDTADVYGTGHSERLLAQALKGRRAIVVSKLGFAFDSATKQITGPLSDPGSVRDAVEASLRRLERETIDMMLLHLNSLPVDQAAGIFDHLERCREAGKIRAYGWSTDFPPSAAAMAERPGFQAVEHAANLFIDLPSMTTVIESTGLWALNRSPLAMGVLTGKFDDRSRMPADDVRRNDLDWMAYFKGGAVAPPFLETLSAVRELLTTGGRTLAQGAIGWLWSRSDRNIPIPGARTVAQIEENTGALSYGPLPAEIMKQIDAVVTRAPEQPFRER